MEVKFFPSKFYWKINMCDNDNIETRIQSLCETLPLSNNEDLLSNVRYLRNVCARGPHIQEFIAKHGILNDYLSEILFNKDLCIDNTLILTSWQLLANAIVNNSTTQTIVWNRYGQSILQNCSLHPIGPHTDIQLMIMYNILNSNSQELIERQVLEAIANVWESIMTNKCELNFEFLHFLYEHFLVKNGRATVRCYSKLNTNAKISVLNYVSSYIRHDSPNGLLHIFILQFFAKEFKMKSDCILRQCKAEDIKSVHPREAYTLLRVIASVSGCEKYGDVYYTDHSLFLNVSSLLRCLIATGKDSSTENIFTPMNKLEEVALTSNNPRHFEKEISFELKTLLVRCVANLLYKNPTNQGYCADTELMATLFECTNMDARNPLMKEWSILAIRNACIGCTENQQMISNLKREGTASNEILSELNLELGSLRINPIKE